MPSEQTLNQNTWTVSFEASLHPVYVHLKIELVLLCTGFVTVISDVPLHVLVHPSKSISKGCILNTLLICDDEVIKCL